MAKSMQFKGLGAMNTLTIFDDNKEDVFDKSVALVSAYSHLLSFYDPQSIVSQINENAGIAAVHVPVRPVFNLIARAIAWSARGLGYNALIGPLVALWRIGKEDERIPSDAEIAERLKLSDPDCVQLDSEAQTVFLTQPGMQLDLGGIGKGFIIDRLTDLWKDSGVTGGIIDLAGNTRLFGNNPEGIPLWQIPITDPRSSDNPAIATLTTLPKAIVSTGIFFRHFDKNGHIYHHLIDPKTGAPVESDMASITVIADSAETADVLSSIGFYAGIPDGIDVIEESGNEAIFISKSIQITQTAGLRETLMPSMGH